VTHHAEDGSGVGSAIIAGEWCTKSIAGLFTDFWHVRSFVPAMTKIRKDAGLYPDV
jgi:hypothetical protein